MKKLGIYIHIPFCVKKCLYCDFLSFENTSSEVQERYVETLEAEINYHSKVYNNEFIVDTIFFGGGTPTLIDANLLKRLLFKLKKSFVIDENAEITLECNPKTVDAEKLAIYRNAGFNRISIGVQTLDDMALKALGRVHKSTEALETYALARESGFANINLDLMFAIPKHTQQVWQDTLEQVIELKPEHLSFYSLQLEEGTQYFELFQKGSLDMVSDKTDREMYHYAVEQLKAAGYHHYEISNCAKPGFECKHNLKYWNMEDYLGLGLGAHSYVNGERFSNVKDLEHYTEGKWVLERHRNNRSDDIVEFIITGMRKINGISMTEFERRFGEKLFEVYPEQEILVREYVEGGLMEIQGDRLKFTLNGIDISNSVLAEFV